MPAISLPLPRNGSTWNMLGTRSYGIVAEVDVLAGTTDRFLVRVELFNKRREPIGAEGRHWYRDVDFYQQFRSRRTRYDMIRDDDTDD